MLKGLMASTTSTASSEPLLSVLRMVKTFSAEPCCAILVSSTRMISPVAFLAGNCCTQVERVPELPARRFGEVGAAAALLVPKEPFARPLVVAEVDEELVDAERARAVLVRQLEERARVLLRQLGAQRLDALDKLLLIQLARAVLVGVAEGVAQLLERPPREEVHHHLHRVLLVPREVFPLVGWSPGGGGFVSPGAARSHLRGCALA
jgi:hypothetical protein